MWSVREHCRKYHHTESCIMPHTCYGLLPLGQGFICLQDGFLYWHLWRQEALEDLCCLRTQEGTKNLEFHWDLFCANKSICVIFTFCLKCSKILYKESKHFTVTKDSPCLPPFPLPVLLHSTCSRWASQNYVLLHKPMTTLVLLWICSSFLWITFNPDNMYKYFKLYISPPLREDFIDY